MVVTNVRHIRSEKGGNDWFSHLDDKIVVNNCHILETLRSLTKIGLLYIVEIYYLHNVFLFLCVK